MSDVFRRMLEQHEKLANSVLSSSFKPATMRIIAQQEEQQRLLAGVLDGYPLALSSSAQLIRAAHEAERQQMLLEGQLNDVRRTGVFDAVQSLRQSLEYRAMESIVDANRRYIDQYRVPIRSEIENIVSQALGLARLDASEFDRDFHRGAVVAAMEAMHHPWLNKEDVNASARAFLNIQTMGAALRGRSAFESDLVQSLRFGLGDWRDQIDSNAKEFADPLYRSGFYLEKGFDPSLTDFPQPAFEESLAVAGLSGLEEDDRETDSAAEDDFARNRAAFDKLQRLETELRQFIQRVMVTEFGADWLKHRLPNGMLDEWQQKRETSIKAGQPERPLIDYADFTDYRKIIERADNWKALFARIFGRPEDIRESFQRLFPVRIATMHARIITLDDELLLVVEVKRILKAINR